MSRGSRGRGAPAHQGAAPSRASLRGGGRGGFRGRGRGRGGGVFVEMRAVEFDYSQKAETTTQSHSTSAAPSFAPSPYPTLKNPPFPYNNSPSASPRGRGRGGRGGRGGNRAPPPMPFFLNEGYRASRRPDMDDSDYIAAGLDTPGGSGSATPHYGLGASHATPSTSNFARARTGGNINYSYSGENPFLKPVSFVKAGTLFEDGEIDVFVRGDGSPSIADPASVEMHHFSLVNAALPHMEIPRHAFEIEVPEPGDQQPQPSLTPTSSNIDLAISSIVSSTSSAEIQEVENALESMAVIDPAPRPTPTPFSFVSAFDAFRGPPRSSTAATSQAGSPPGGSMDIPDEEKPDDTVVLEDTTLELMIEDNVEVEIVEDDDSPVFFVDIEPSPVVSAASSTAPVVEASEAESLGFFVDSEPAAAETSGNYEAASRRYVHAAVLGDPLSESDEEIVWTPQRSMGVEPSPVSIALPASIPALPVPAAVTFRDFALELTTVALPSTSRQPKTKARPGKKALKAMRKAARNQKRAESPPAPREDDSDIEWGSDGPPVQRGKGSSGWIKNPIPNGARDAPPKRGTRAEEEAAILADYIANTRGSDGEDDEDGMRTFLEGVNNVEEVSIGDIAIERLMREEDEGKFNDGESDSSSRGELHSPSLKPSRRSANLATHQSNEDDDSEWATNHPDPGVRRVFAASEVNQLGWSGESEEEGSDDNDMDNEQIFLDEMLESDDSDDLGDDFDIVADESDSDDNDDLDASSDSSEDLAEAILRSQRARSKSVVEVESAEEGTQPQTVAGSKKGKEKAKAQEPAKKKGKGKARALVSSDDDHELFKGNFSWDDDDERFIQNLLDNNSGIINGKDRAAKKKLFKAINRGNFEDYEDDFVVATPVSRSKREQLVPEHLRAQWDKDHAKKAEYKRQRAEARLAAELDPYSSSSKNKFKKKFRHQDLMSGDDSDNVGPRHKEGIVDLHALDAEIQFFLRDLGKTTMSLPPMDKESRKRVHVLAACYTIKTQSRGAGRKRFTILTKTSRSGLNNNQKKIKQTLKIAAARGDSFTTAAWGPRSGSGNHTMPSKSGFGLGNDAAKRKEGEVVGEGAKMLGEDNLGHRLLSKMGWAEGGKIGKGDGGLNQPIMAIVKNTKYGLGHN